MTDSPPKVSRRTLLRSVPAVAAASAAGCSGLLGDGSSTATDRPTETGTAAATATDTATPTATPELPNVRKRTVQRDRAAITHISAVVQGQLEWPTAELANLSIFDVAGVWETDTQTLWLYPDATFHFQDSDSDYGGTYRVSEETLFFDPEQRRSFSYGWKLREGTDVERLVLLENGVEAGFYRRADSYTSDQAIVDMFETLRPRPADDGTTESTELKAGGSGSGFIVSPDGYVVTNAHVVLADRDRERLLYRRLAGRRGAIRNAISGSLAEDLDVSEEARSHISQVMTEKLLTYYQEQGQLGNVTESFYVLNDDPAPDQDRQVGRWEATVEREGNMVTEVDGEPSWGRDIAILKVDRTNLPSVTLGDASTVETGDEIFVIGYPDLGIDFIFEDRDTALEPTLTTGVVSARRTLNAGIEAIQTDAAINNGNSGGPMYDENGEVVGVATFKPADANVEDIQFGLPIDLAREFMAEVGVENESGEMDTSFDDGLAAYWRGDCETATAKMQRALELYPEHPSARQYVEDCENGEAPGQ